jgi:hypothetical protein
MPPPASAVSQLTSGPQRGRERVPIMGTALICAVPLSRAVFAGQRVDSGVRRGQPEALARG